MMGAMTSAKVVVLGSINADYVLHVPERPHPGETISGAVLELHPGGKGANQAVAAARCGATVEMIGRVGNDAAGRSRRAELTAEGIGTDHIWMTSDAATGAAFITVTPDGENAIVVAPGANGCIARNDIDRADAILKEAALLVMQLEVPIEAVVRGAELAGRGTLVVLNAAPVCPLPPRLLQRVDLLVANAQEAAALLGGVRVDEHGALDAAAGIRGLGPKTAVVTLGPLGAVAATADQRLQVPAPRVAAVDTTGAGDAFVGALVARLAAGATLADALHFGVAIGSATVTTRGASARVAVPIREGSHHEPS